MTLTEYDDAGAAKESRRALAAAAAMTILAALVATYDGGRREETALAAEPVASLPFATREPEPPESPPALPRPDSGLSFLLNSTRNPSVGEILRALERRANADVRARAAADAFRLEFERDPVLSSTWHRYAGRPGGQGSADDFAAELAKLPEFHAALERVLSRPGAESLYRAVASDPLLAPSVARLYEAIRPRRQAPPS
ncbi:MAG: hypothetical protein HY925_00325 [Elusimicrobia bacterium]|nr:hypothetical protein [Elusimicrobiota bacterium]